MLAVGGGQAVRAIVRDRLKLVKLVLAQSLYAQARRAKIEACQYKQRQSDDESSAFEMDFLRLSEQLWSETGGRNRLCLCSQAQWGMLLSESASLQSERSLRQTRVRAICGTF